MLAFSKSDVVRDPYPHAIKTNVLEQSFYQRLKGQFPKEDFFQKIAPVMGNRRRVASDEPAFYEFLDRSEAWKTFYAYLNSDAFVHLAIDLFGDQLKAFECRFDPNKPWKFDPHHHASVLRDKQSAVRSRIRKFRERYMQNRQELFVQLALFKHREKKPLSEYERFPKDSDTVLLESVSPEDDKAAIFLCTKNSYHSVPLVKDAKAWRNFIYFGLTAKADSLWR